jgi:peroxiredoxin
MKPAILCLFVLVCACTHKAAEPAPSAAKPPKPALEILKEIGAARGAVPQFDETRSSDEAYKKQFDADFTAAQMRVADLALELYRADPTQPNVPVMLRERWMILCQLDKTDEAVAEIDSVLAKSDTPPAVAKEARVSRPQAHLGKLSLQPESPDMKRLALAEAAVDDLLRASPKDPAALEMLWQIGLLYDGHPEKERAIFQRMVDEFPDARRDAAHRGKLRQLDGVGKPFELAFDDVVSGEHVDLATMRGKPVVVIFWSSAIPRATDAIPAQKAARKKYEGRVEFVGVSVDAAETEVETPGVKNGKLLLLECIASNDIDWPQYYQGKGWVSEFSTSWGVLKVPQVFVVDPEGNLAATNVDRGLDELLDRLLAKQAK